MRSGQQTNGVPFNATQHNKETVCLCAVSVEQAGGRRQPEQERERAQLPDFVPVLSERLTVPYIPPHC